MGDDDDCSRCGIQRLEKFIHEGHRKVVRWFIQQQGMWAGG